MDDIYGNRRKNNPKKLYHITPYVNLNKIMSNGLEPKSNSKIAYHSERVYFLTDISNEQAIRNFISKLYVTSKKPDFIKEKYIILEIDLNRAPYTIDGYEKPPIRFFTDPNMKDAVFTMENIHPNAITPIKIVDIVFEDEDKIFFNVEINNI